MTASSSRKIVIDGHVIQEGDRPYIIAELSGNHNGKIERAFRIMEAAKQAGANAIKLQTYTADTMTIDHDGPGFVVDLPLWKGRKLHDLYNEAYTPWEWHEALFEKGRELGITIFSSPFDLSAVDFLESMDVPAYKIASPELVDIPLIEYVAATGKPMIMSTGMATLDEIDDAVEAARGSGCDQLILLHCVSAYPAPYAQSSLVNIVELSSRYGVIAGLSDHTLGTVVPVAATALGALVIEKHFTLSRSDGGVDSAFSIEPAELARLVEESGISAMASTGPSFGPKDSEKGVLVYRRSLYAVKDIMEGECLTDNNVRSIRPGFGLAPKYQREVLSKVARRDIVRGEPISWDMLI